MTNPIATLGSLLFAPSDVPTNASRGSTKRVTVVGTLAGMVGLGIQVGWLIPEDLIGFGYKFEQALLVNKVLGAAIGVLLVLVLALFERLVFALLKQPRSAGTAIHGSLAVFLTVPFVAIPLHSYFPAGITVSGHVELFWILVVLFITWHVCVLGSLLHANPAEPSSHHSVLPVLVVLLILEIGASILFLSLFPAAFKLTPTELFMEWI